MIEFRILGPLEAVEGDRALPLGGAKQRGLLAILLLNRREVISTDRLIDELWGGQPPETAARTLHVYISHLRKLVGADLLLTRGRGYLLAATHEQVDADRFRALAVEGRSALDSGDPARASECLRAALALWRGPALADFAYEQFAQTEIGRMEEQRLAVLEDRIDADLAAGRHAELVAELEALIRQHPLSERLHRQLMLALYRAGRQAEALEAYRRARQTLLDGLGLEPGPELQRLEAAILAHDESVQAPARERLPRRGGAERRLGRGATLIAAGGLVLLGAAIAAAFESGGGGIEVSENSVAAIDPGSGEIVADVPVGTRPGEIAAGEGGVWVANTGDETVSQIDVGTRRVAGTVAPGSAVDDLTLGEGAVWTSASEGGRVKRIDPALRRVDGSVRLGTRTFAASGGPLATGKGSVWVGTPRSSVARIDPKRIAVEAHSRVGNHPSGIAVGEGSVWVADAFDATVTRIDPASNGVLATIPVHPGPSAVAAGEGGVWVVQPFDDAVTRIDPRTDSVTDTITVGSRPAGVAVGGGAVWVANGGDGTITRIDPRTRQVTGSFTVGGSPQDAVLADGLLWVTVQAAPAGAAASGDETVRVFEEEEPTLDPALSGVSPLAFATCALLLNYPDRPFPAGSHLRPEVAEAMPTVSNGGRTYTYRLRDDFRFSPPSGEPVTAAAFRRAIERSLDPRMHSFARELLDDVVGFGAYSSGRSNHLAGVVATGNRLEVTLTRPSPTLPARLANQAFCAIPPNTPVDPAGIDSIPSAGPYYVASSSSDGEVLLSRNPGYGGDRPQTAAAIDLLPPIDQPDAIAAVKSGRADVVPVLPGKGGEATLRAEYGRPGSEEGGQEPRYLSAPSPAISYLVLNTRRELFSETRMRRAVNFAIDRPALSREPYPGVSGRPTDQYIPQGVHGFREATVYPLSGPDPAKARRLAGDHGGRAVMFTCNAASCRRAAEVVRANLAAIGIAVRVHQFPFNTLFRKLVGPAEAGEPGHWDLATTNWFADYPDPYDFLNVLFESVPGLRHGNFNLGGFDEPRFQRRLRRVAEITGPRRYRAYARLDAALLREAAPIATYANQTTNYFFSERVGCQFAHPVYHLDLPALCANG